MNVVPLRRAVGPPTKKPKLAPGAKAAEGRVQVRLTLDTLEQADRDLHILADAIALASETVRRALKTRDALALGAVRAALEVTNKRLNVTPARRINYSSARG